MMGVLARLPAPTIAAALCLGAGCGSTGGSPMAPSESPPAAPIPGGVVAGAYVLQIEGAAGCLVPLGPHRIPVVASPTGTPAQPGVQVLPAAGGAALELEFLHVADTLRGGLGTTEQGVLTAAGLRVYLRTIGTGAVTHLGSGRGEVLSGTMFGELAFSRPGDGELTTLGVCTALEHRWKLTVS
jgi:hypothetical protein